MRLLRRVGFGLVALVAVGFGVRGVTAPAAGARPARPAVVPVLASVVTAQPMRDAVQGLGTVQAFNTVSVKPQVNGQITKVFFTQGQAVTAGQTLFLIDPRPYQAVLDQAMATAAKDQATLTGAVGDLARYGGLVRQNYTSAKIYQDQRATVAELKATVKVDAAAVESARLNLGYTLIRAPIAGRTGAILVNVGNVVQTTQNTTLVTIAQTKPIYVSFALPQDDLAAIRQHQGGPDAGTRLVVEAYGADGHSVLAHGQLQFINNLIDTTTGTVSLMGQFDNASETLWPGEYVTATLVLSVQPKALTVPATAVVEGPSGYYAYVIGANDTVTRRTVTVARTQDGLAIIAKGLAAGERVVREGQFRLVNGAKVKIDKSKTVTGTAAAS
jgi:multidrug efflux system membrane fusion protein